MEAPLIELDHVEKDYGTGTVAVRALIDVNLCVSRGEFVAIVGTSGSGKSTMMNIIGCLDRPTRGHYRLGPVEVGGRSNDGRAIVRNRMLGFIFQGYNLLPRTTALENVELPLVYRGVKKRERRRRAELALHEVGLENRMHHKPNQLSGGQQQRVAIARAIITDPTLIVADEPTGDLDRTTGGEILALLERLNDDLGKTIIMVTHDPKAAERAHRLVHLEKGVLVD